MRLISDLRLQIDDQFQMSEGLIFNQTILDRQLIINPRSAI